ncbi:hypothetical protein J421_3480 [Gemmatirosa kalamazoonensis]|uniref:Capsule assembly protein Wzi n=1 Tax=Gemmatirosa kalamazoonensis TaxID=861299 RepID=W0RKQ1_9BACT|nr:hypothetical protein [Gemmatirosa kalamazoonensis]AHG91017.1 hypothetical protein J421_3480 [Gemmatirosa kalamazoonensis]
MHLASPRLRRLGALLTLAAPVALRSQSVTALTPSWQEAIAARDVEMYLRVAQVAGQAPLAPWTIRALSPEALDGLARDAGHPWSARFRRDTTRALRVHVFSPELDLIGTTGYPVLGVIDGAVWAGRGLTTVLTGGAQLRTRHLSLTVRPTLFRAENVHFSEAPVDPTVPSPHGDAIWGCCIDAPQRFGTGAYMRIDPGESTLRFWTGPVAVGVSSATQAWGPSDENPLVLGAGAAGIPHVFVETSHPLSVGIGRVQARLLIGRPSHSIVPTDSARARKVAGGVVSFTPRGVPALEVGLARFFHAWLQPEGLGPADFLVPLSGLFATSRAPKRFDDPTAPDFRPKNEIASVFARWVSVAGHAELWGEYVKNDHPLDRRDLVVEPDHDAAWSLGARKVVRATPRRTTALSAEYVSAGVSHLNRVRTQTPMYIHFPITEGHTQLGQLLASTAATGGGGFFLRLDTYTQGGARSVGLERFIRQTPAFAEGPPESGYDVVYRLRADATLFRARADVVVGALAEYELNRDFRRDVPNFQIRLGLRPRRTR